MGHRGYLLLLSGILLAKALGMVLLILYGGIGLSPDEAQYWTWSQQLDWGYYSKPPGIAWQIWTGTQLFGNTELGVRFFSLIWGTLLSLSVYTLGFACHLRPQTCFWAALAMALSPLGFFSSFLAITDGGQVVFWTLATLFVCMSLRNNTNANYLLIGLMIACGALFKWNIYLFWIFIFLFMPFYKNLRSKTLVAGLLISLIGLFPSVIWNQTHDWATFKHVYSTVVQEGSPVQSNIYLVKGNFLEFIGAQISLVSPIFFFLLIISYIYLLKNWQLVSAPLLFCGYSSFAILFTYCFAALFQKIQGNWCDFAYPLAIVYLVWYCLECRRAFKWIQSAVAVSVILIVMAISIPHIQSDKKNSLLSIPYSINPFRHSLGWDRLDEILQAAGYDADKHFLFSDKYQTVSELSFYGPNQKRAYFLNLNGIRKNQFSYWPGMGEEQLGRTGYFVVVENSPHLEKLLSYRIGEISQNLSQYSQDVQFVGVYPIFENNSKMVKGALLFKCNGYNGTEPTYSNKY